MDDPICPMCKLWDKNHSMMNMGVLPVIVCPKVPNGKIYVADDSSLIITHVFDPWVLAEKDKSKALVEEPKKEA